ncbi:MAG: molybdopterin cofactor-binding domain-containing protein, partial [Pseudomonadota bacterium]
MTVHISRRRFLQTSAAGAAALLVGLDSKGALAAGSHVAELNPFVRIDAQGNLTVILKHFEMGQGTATGLATLVAEELDADWDRVSVEFSEADPQRYQNLFFGIQGTGGSSSIANSYMQYREAGAIARDLLIRAAAAKWHVEASAVQIENSQVFSGDRRAHFGEFIAEASRLQPVQNVRIKQSGQFKLIGNTTLARKDSYAKTNGTARFALDVQMPGIVHASVVRSPRFGGKLSGFDTSAAKGIAGFIDAIALPNQSGVVVYGKNTWAVLSARRSIAADWDFSGAESRSTEEISDAHVALLDAPHHQAGPVDVSTSTAEIAKATETVEAEFLFPYLAHAPMEPLNCVIEPTERGVRFHDGCQIPTLVQGAVAEVLGLDLSQIEINTVYAGGSFGRRATPTADYQVDAALAFKLLG